MATIQDEVNTTTLVDVQQESVKMDSGVAPMPLIEGDSNQAVLTPIIGAVKYVNIKGLSGGTFASAQAFIAKLEKWVQNGGKSSKPTLIYTGDLNTTPINCRAITGDWQVSADEPFIVYYSLQLVEGELWTGI